VIARRDITVAVGPVAPAMFEALVLPPRCTAVVTVMVILGERGNRAETQGGGDGEGNESGLHGLLLGLTSSTSVRVRPRQGVRRQSCRVGRNRKHKAETALAGAGSLCGRRQAGTMDGCPVASDPCGGRHARERRRSPCSSASWCRSTAAKHPPARWPPRWSWHATAAPASDCCMSSTC